jgi:hypothetical protein
MARRMADAGSGESWIRVRDLSFYRQRTAILLVLSVPLVALCIYTVGALVPVCKNLLISRQRLLDAQQRALTTVPELEQKIAALNEQMRVLTTSSIESRLNTIETAIHVGNVRPEQIAALEDTRKQLETLKTYMFSDPKRLVDLQKLQSDYRSLKDDASTYATKDDLKTQLSSLHNLWTLSLWIFGIIVSVLLVPRLFARKPSVTTTPTAPPPPAEPE